MVVGVGSKYMENLGVLAHLARQERLGCYHERLEVTIFEEDAEWIVPKNETAFHIGRRCIYDKCPDKKICANKIMRISQGDGRNIQTCYFHPECLDALVGDERFSKNVN